MRIALLFREGSSSSLLNLYLTNHIVFIVECDYKMLDLIQEMQTNYLDISSLNIVCSSCSHYI